MVRGSVPRERVGVARVLILFLHPNGLALEDGDAWASGIAAPFRTAPGVVSVAISPLAPPPRNFARHWDWLLEITTDTLGAAERLLRDTACRDLLLDLRLLGTAPRVVLTAGAAT